MVFQFYGSLADLPEGVVRWWEATADSLFLTRWWMATLVETGLDAGGAVAIGTLSGDDGAPLAVLPCLFSPRRLNRDSPRVLKSLTGIYSCLFRPVIAEGRSRRSIAQTLGRSIAQSLDAADLVHFDALDADWPELAAFEAGLREYGLRAARYDHFGNWREALNGRSFADYLASRPGAVREILRRKRRAADRKSANFAIARNEDELTALWHVYDDVYGRSWKPPEPYPDFHAELASRAAREGALRLGILRVAASPVAVQLWIAWRGTATVLKLAHDEKFAELSPGSLLTAHMIEYMIQWDGISTLDFGRGDDPYKRLWATDRRQRIGLLAANPRSPGNALLLGRQRVGNWVRGLTKG